MARQSALRRIANFCRRTAYVCNGWRPAARPDRRGVRSGSRANQGQATASETPTSSHGEPGDRMKRFYGFYGADETVAQLVRQIPWGHNIEIFQNLKLHCYVVIELKTGPFRPEYAGKLNFYLTAVDEQVKAPEDNPSIGLILCRDRDNLVAEYALRDLAKPIGVSRYELASTLPEALRASLPTLEEVETELRRRP